MNIFHNKIVTQLYGIQLLSLIATLFLQYKNDYMRHDSIKFLHVMHHICVTPPAQLEKLWMNGMDLVTILPKWIYGEARNHVGFSQQFTNAIYTQSTNI